MPNRIARLGRFRVNVCSCPPFTVESHCIRNDPELPAPTLKSADNDGFECWGDEELIAVLTVRMNERFFEILYQRHVRWVWRRSFEYLTDQSKHFTWDICLRTFRCLWREFSEAELDGPLDDFFARTIPSLAKTFGSRAEQSTGCPEEQWMQRLLRTAADDAGLAGGIRHAIKSLPLHWRQVVIWRYWEERSLAEMASSTAFPFGIIRWRHFQAVRRIEEILDEGEGQWLPDLDVYPLPVPASSALCSSSFPR